MRVISAGRFRQAAATVRALWRDRPLGTLLVFLFAGYALTVVLSAWLADDAYITFRVVDNAINGYGFVWNVGERVQAYTNPLMMLLMTALAFVTREVYFTSIALCIAASLVAVGILSFKVARSRVSAIVALIVLIASVSFTAYSTSGLETSLIFMLAALFFWQYLRRDRYDFRSLAVLVLLFSLSIVNRMDIALLLLPALLFAFWRNDGVGWLRMAGAAALGAVPFVAWETFSLVYYGFPFPNTAYAKLNTGIPSSEYLIRGVWYYLLTALADPIVVLGIVVGAAAVLLARQAKTSVPLIGVALYLVYILRIGGDFMRGRYFTAPLLVVLLLFVSIEPERWRRYGVTTLRLVLGALSLLLAQQVGFHVYRAMDMNHVTPYGIYNDEAIYWPASNLPANLLRDQMGRSRLVQQGREFRAAGRSPVVWATLGFAGYYAGPRVHVVDPLALNDALLARIPAIYDPEWKIGHAERYIPEGYLETVETGENRIADPGLAEYYDKLSLVTRGDLWSRERWRAIYEINTGKLDHLIDREHYRFEVESELDIDSL